MSTLNTYNLKSPDSANTNIALDASGNIAVRAGSAASPSIYVTGDSNTGIYSPGADQVAISTGGSGRLFVDSAGRVGVGTSSPGAPLEVNGGDGLLIKGSSTDSFLQNYATSNNYIEFKDAGGSIGSIQYAHSDDSLRFKVNASERLRITSAGLVGVGTSSPAQILHCTTTNGTASQLQFTQQFQREYRIGIPASSTSFEIYDVSAGANRLTIDSSGRLGVSETAPGTFDVRDAKITLTDSTSDGIGIKGRRDSLDRWYVGYNSSDHLEINQLRNNTLAFKTNNTEVARLTNSGQLLVGTSSSPTSGDSQYARLRVQGNTLNTEGFIAIARDEAASGITSGEVIGQIFYTDSAGNAFGVIKCEADANAGTNDYPGRLVFSATADGASSPTERMRISQNGRISLDGNNQTAPEENTATNGITFNCASGSHVQFAKIGAAVAGFNRMTDDGTIIRLMQAGTEEGTISVSGTTVSYNGAHLSRWSQLPSGAERTEILRGTILSNIDEMCEWGDEDNEQLNRMKVSDVEGDKNVSGVFQAWDDDDDTYINDFYCAMTGDFIIRIGAGVTVERGDLLMSAGDGTAKPQGDGYVQDKTIAKVTSTNVSCTYDDGSYCVPCVLMAC